MIFDNNLFKIDLRLAHDLFELKMIKWLINRFGAFLERSGCLILNLCLTDLRPGGKIRYYDKRRVKIIVGQNRGIERRR